MASAEPDTQELLEERVRDGFSSDRVLENRLEFSSDGNGYMRSESLREDTDLFSQPLRTFKSHDELSDDNVVLNPGEAAVIFENYFGQYSFGYENLQEYLEDSAGREKELEEDIGSLEGSLVMDVVVFEDGNQHVSYSEGKVAKELIEYVIDQEYDDGYVLDLGERKETIDKEVPAEGESVRRMLVTGS